MNSGKAYRVMLGVLIVYILVCVTAPPAIAFSIYERGLSFPQYLAMVTSEVERTYLVAWKDLVVDASHIDGKTFDQCVTVRSAAFYPPGESFTVTYFVNIGWFRTDTYHLASFSIRLPATNAARRDSAERGYTRMSRADMLQAYSGSDMFRLGIKRPLLFGSKQAAFARLLKLLPEGSVTSTEILDGMARQELIAGDPYILSRVYLEGDRGLCFDARINLVTGEVRAGENDCAIGAGQH